MSELRNLRTPVSWPLGLRGRPIDQISSQYVHVIPYQ
uniref:Uncharacterized protein n=1 Tax=Anguilla anguilla TaxID=7936 RepID=A0A0E9RR86_ANGAN